MRILSTSSCLALLCAFYCHISYAQQTYTDTTTATIIKTRSGKHTHTYLFYTAHGVEYRSNMMPPYGRSLPGAAYIIAYDTANPKHIDPLNFSRPIFLPGEQTDTTIARIIQTNFGTDIVYSTDQFSWIKYVYYTPKSRHPNKLRKHTGYYFYPSTALTDTNIKAGSLYSVRYASNDPDRSILQPIIPVISTNIAPAQLAPLQHYKLRSLYWEGGITAGYTGININPNYTTFRYNFSDPTSQARLDRTYTLPSTIRNYGFSLNLFTIYSYHKAFISYLTPLSFTVAWSGSNTTYTSIGITKGYQIQLTHHYHGYQYKLHPALKLKAAIGLNYSSLSYRLGKLTSANSNAIKVEGKDIATNVTVNYFKNYGTATPELGLCLRLSNHIELQTSCIYNYTINQEENITFKHDKQHNGKTDLANYLTAPTGSTITGNLFSNLPPLTFKAEIMVLF